MTNEQTAVMIEGYFELVCMIKRELVEGDIDKTKDVVQGVIDRIGGDIDSLRGIQTIAQGPR